MGVRFRTLEMCLKLDKVEKDLDGLLAVVEDWTLFIIDLLLDAVNGPRDMYAESC